MSTKIAFTMQLMHGKKEEYKRRHNKIWPELSQLLSDSGISDYTIFLDKKTNTLFAVYTLLDNNNVTKLPSHPVMKKWWDYMKDIMLTNADNSPVSQTLEKVFYMK